MIITNNYLPNQKYCAFASEGEQGYYQQWPDEKGMQPRDMSLGYIDLKDFGRLHVYHIDILKAKLLAKDKS